MPSVVIDANLLISALVPSERNAAVDRQLDLWREAGTRICAPPHFFSEVMNALRKKVYQGQYDQETGDRLVELFGLFSVERVLTPHPFSAAWVLAREYDLPSTYDAEYMALAQLEDCEFWTADMRFVRQLGARRPNWVRAVG